MAIINFLVLFAGRKMKFDIKIVTIVSFIPPGSFFAKKFRPVLLT